MRVVLTATPKKSGPVVRTEVPPRPLGPARTPSRVPDSTASHDDIRDRLLTTLHPSASVARGAGITKVAEALAVPVAIVFARLISSTVSCLKCGNVQSTPFLHCPFRKKRQ